MRLAPALTCILSITSITFAAGFALAQSKPVRIRRFQPLRAHPRAPAKTPPQTQAEKVCAQRRALLNEVTSRQDDRRAELVGLEAEIVALTTRLKQLGQRKHNLGVEITRAERGVTSQRNAWQSQCAKAGTCRQYEQLADTLDARQKPLVQYLERMRGEIAKIRQDLTTLRQQIPALQADYKKLACGNLVPGQTSQATINRCMAIFSEWNRVQTDVNNNNSRFPALRSRYQRTAQQLDGTVEQAAEYETFLAANCKTSPQLEVVKRYRGVRDRAQSLHAELDALAKDVTSLESIRITVK